MLTQCMDGSADVEDITAKTGNYKKFNVFVRMLLSAIRQESESVFVDLLTYADLETLKSKKGPGQAPLKRTIPPNNKRYLILTYAAEFDRVHYPLPLLFEEPTVQHLQSVVQQLRAQLGQSALGAIQPGSKAKHQDTALEISRLRDENCTLRRQLQEAEQPSASTESAHVEGLRLKQAEHQQEILLVRLCKMWIAQPSVYSRFRLITHSMRLDALLAAKNANSRLVHSHT